MTREATPDRAGDADSAFGPRFEIRHPLGSSGMGVVYAAWDTALEQHVALKTTHRLDPLGLALFKNEFRALADIDHPNLVRLYQLFGDPADEQWFFTMELVDGPPLLAWLWGDDGHAGTPTASPSELLAETDPALRTTFEPGPGQGGPWPVRPPPPPAVEQRLRSALIQLTRGVSALHARGLVHRDIKPDNVRVDGDGRVVLLDFGLAVRPDGTAGEGHSGGFVVGTRGYMSPQQARGMPPGESDDWYSVGALLYHALTGRPPIRLDDRPPPLDATGRPATLVALTRALLQTEPDARPGADDILLQLGAPPAARRAPADLVGRRAIFGALDRARARCAAGQPSLTHLWGPSGVGKSFAVEAWLGEHETGVGDGTGALVLRGRSHRREDVPFGPFDSLVDDLARRLTRWPDETQGLVPVHAAALVRQFPALTRVHALAGLDAPEEADPRALRQRALAALREMLLRITRHRPVVLFLDDVQNGGLDAAALLSALLAPPGAPPVHIISCARRTDGSPLIDALQSAAEASGTPWAECCVPVGPLPAAESRQLAQRLLGPDASDERVERVVTESQGHPFLIAELATRARMRLDVPEAQLSLDEAIRARVADLPQAARAALEIIALAGRPLPPRTILAAAGLEADGHRALATLRAASLARGGLAPRSPIEPWHDAITRAVADGLDTTSCRVHHRALAEQIEAGRDPDAPDDAADFERLVRHWEGAGEPLRAAGRAVQGGEAAMARNAFEQGAFFFREALRLGPADARIQRALAGALQLGGRADEAADAWLESGRAAPPTERRLAERTAAEQWLISGRVGRARALLAALMKRAGLRRRSRRPAMVGSVVRSALTAFVRGRFARLEPAGAVDPKAAEHFDLCMAELAGWYAMSPLEIAWTLGRASRLGPRAGDRRRAALGFAFARMFVELSRLPGSRAIAERLMAAADDLADGGPEARIPLATIDIAVAVRQGRWTEAVEAGARLDAELSQSPALTGWEPLLHRALYCFSTGLAGRYDALAERLPAMLSDARQRGARVEEGLIALLGGVTVHLAHDDPDAADGAVDDFIERWDEVEASALSVLAIIKRARIARYRGDARAAVEIIRAAWPRIGALSGGRFNFLRDFTHLEQGLSGLFALGRLPEAEQQVQQSIGVLRDGTWGAGAAWAEALAAGLMAAEGDRAGARRRLMAARRRFPTGAPPPRIAPLFDLHAARWIDDAEAIAAAEAALRAQGVRVIARWAHAIAPLPVGPSGEAVTHG